jgi:3-oxoacyl-[acyl-carrier protein] reductase
MNLAGRVAVVTGGTRGVGWAVARRLSAEGAFVALTGRDARQAEERARELGGEACGFGLEVTDRGSVRACIERVVERFGRVEILVNNAGMVGPFVPTIEYTPEDWRRVIETNLDGPFHCIQAVLPHILPGKWGRIVSVASMAGKDGNASQPAYSAAKAGLIALTKSLGKELAATGILANCVALGPTDTDMSRSAPQWVRTSLVGKVPLGRMASPEEAAALIVWLCSNECTYSTGAVYDFSGGRATY